MARRSGRCYARLAYKQLWVDSGVAMAVALLITLGKIVLIRASQASIQNGNYTDSKLAQRKHACG